jgi:hypothetical protein
MQLPENKGRSCSPASLTLLLPMPCVRACCRGEEGVLAAALAAAAAAAAAAV